MSGPPPALSASGPASGDGWPGDGQARAGAAAARAVRDAYGRLLARLTRRTRDLEAAEDALCHALAKALETWPQNGVPRAPEAWLTTVALNALRDKARHTATKIAAAETLKILQDERDDRKLQPDERLGLILAASHPAIAPAVHAPLILQTVFGVTAQEMAPAFLVAPSTLSQRLVRAKAKIRLAGIPFDTDPPDRTERLGRALDAIYALYTIALSAAPSPAARARASDARHLAKIVAALAPNDAEALGLLALINFCEAREPAHRTPEGHYVPLSKQDTGLWIAALIEDGEVALRAASVLKSPGPYQLEAAVQSVHCDRKRTGRTEWAAIAAFYDVLSDVAPTMGAAVARAAAHGQAFGPEAGLRVLAQIGPEGVSDYQPYWAVRATLAARTGADDGTALERAMALTDDHAVRRHLSTLVADDG